MREYLRMLAQALCLLLMIIILSFAPTAHAYTQEQKNQAKAWLSAHGYPPTEDGAWQAYSDWLDGQWWDEFGSPAEYFGWDEDEDEEDEDEDDDDEERPTAATQKSQQGNADGNKSAAETLVDMMKEDGSAAESSPSETEPATSAAIQTTAAKEPTAATQADIEDLVGAVEEKDSERTKKNLPLALAGLGCVAVLFIGAIWWDRRRR